MTGKIIAVVGATGAQGGGLCRAILKDKNAGYRVRALTRNTESVKAKELEKMGAEVVRADVGDVESLKRAFHGAHGAFCVTFFWEHFSPEKEVAEANNMAIAANHIGVEHAIWSTLEDTRNWVPLSDSRMPTLHGNYKVPHFDGKGEANRAFTELGVPTTFLLTSFYWENLIYFGMGPKKGPDGNLYITLPMGDKKLPGIASGDIGKCAYAIFRKGREFLGKTVGLAGDHLTGYQMAACPPRHTAGTASPVRMTWAICSSSSVTSRITSAGPAASISRGPSTRRCIHSRPGLQRTRTGSRSRRMHGGPRENSATDP